MSDEQAEASEKPAAQEASIDRSPRPDLDGRISRSGATR